MLDIATSLVFVEVLTVVNCVTTFLLWRANPKLRGLAEVSISCLALTLTFGLMAFRTPHIITVSNAVTVFAIAMVTEGMTVLAGRPPMRWLVYALTVFTAVLWEFLQWQSPDDAPIRVVAATIIYVGLYGRVVYEAFRNGRRFGAARVCLIASLLIHIAVLIARMTVALLHPDPNFVFSPMVLPWFMLENSVVMTTVFFSIMIMVGTRVDEDLQQRTQSLEAERRMHGRLKQFLSTLGHELHTPLAIIDRSAEMGGVLLTHQQGEIAPRLDTIRATVERMRRLMNNLLMAERAELVGGGGDLVDLGKVLGDLTQILAQKYEEERIVVNLPHGGSQVRGDREMLATALGNLIDNALKYSPKDQPVLIQVRNDDAVHIAVSDKGIGFPLQQMAKVGQRFFRAANVADIPGTGLGLNIVKTVVEKHGGRLHLANGQDGGAVVTIALPAVSG
ncbi:HAMP domain-containing sensor histidine kinase [Magnetospirillum sp. 15-1]|uniref:sensor histidine kinase n=1 Tax=Magnetospirillum sp. 15-1 TaxID=1979370 RepID=UPI000BBCC637|nr:HAMP domain-containing sensor histidine kinase [Magnetospirillum sp. 15-1]